MEIVERSGELCRAVGGVGGGVWGGHVMGVLEETRDWTREQRMLGGHSGRSREGGMRNSGISPLRRTFQQAEGTCPRKTTKATKEVPLLRSRRRHERPSADISINRVVGRPFHTPSRPVVVGYLVEEARLLVLPEHSGEPARPRRR